MADARWAERGARPRLDLGAFAPALLVAAACLAALSIAARAGALRPTAEGVPGWIFYALSQLLVTVDTIDVLVRVYLRRVHTLPLRREGVAPVSTPIEIGEFTPYQMRLHLRPWAILVAVREPGEELERFVEGLGPFRDRLWVIDDDSRDDTCERLARAGIPFVRADRNWKKPGAIKQLLRALPPEIETVVVMDPDSRIRTGGDQQISDLERSLFEFQRSRMAAVCPRIAIRPDGWLARFQELEYWMAFSLGRKSMADHSVTSGIAVYRRDALAHVLEAHTLSVYAEDLKNAFLLMGRGERIYYDGRLVVETDGKRTLREWFSQRVGWHHGLLKVYSEHLRDVVRSAGGRAWYVYHFLVYMGVFTLLLHPLKLLGVAVLLTSLANGLDNGLGLNWIPDSPATDPLYFPIAYARYTLLALLVLPLAVGRGERLRLMPVSPLYFFYAIGQLVPGTIGYLNWIALRLTGRRIWRDHYQDEASLREEASLQRRNGGNGNGNGNGNGRNA